MSMLVFYINRAGRSLSPQRRQVLDRTKKELCHVFVRPAGAPTSCYFVFFLRVSAAFFAEVERSSAVL
ncbi:MAG: DUF3175 domain-containing protein [Acetobacter sp.]|uniref:DUF3175 domain-containing protein n=1 Tax=Acetobacter sp. TaxID=440 RepID=UPI0039EC12C0